jgi:hypothetical protein
MIIIDLRLRVEHGATISRKGKTMRNPRCMMIAAGLVTSLLLWAPVALADDTVCRGILGEVTVVNLIVPDGSTCTLNGTRIEGNIHVGTGATLGANGVDVDGNIQAEGAQSVNVVALHGVRSFVGGNIQIKQGGPLLSAASTSGRTCNSRRIATRSARPAMKSVAIYRPIRTPVGCSS